MNEREPGLFLYCFLRYVVVKMMKNGKIIIPRNGEENRRKDLFLCGQESFKSLRNQSPKNIIRKIRKHPKIKKIIN